MKKITSLLFLCLCFTINIFGSKIWIYNRTAQQLYPFQSKKSPLHFPSMAPGASLYVGDGNLKEVYLTYFYIDKDSSTTDDRSGFHLYFDNYGKKEITSCKNFKITWAYGGKNPSTGKYENYIGIDHKYATACRTPKYFYIFAIKHTPDETVYSNTHGESFHCSSSGGCLILSEYDEQPTIPTTTT